MDELGEFLARGGSVLECRGDVLDRLLDVRALLARTGGDRLGHGLEVEVPFVAEVVIDDLRVAHTDPFPGLGPRSGEDSGVVLVDSHERGVPGGRGSHAGLG